MKYCIIPYFIWILTVCHSTCYGGFQSSKFQDILYIIRAKSLVTRYYSFTCNFHISYYMSVPYLLRIFCYFLEKSPDFDLVFQGSESRISTVLLDVAELTQFSLCLWMRSTGAWSPAKILALKEADR